MGAGVPRFLDGAFHLQTLQEAGGVTCGLSPRWHFNDPDATAGTLVAFRKDNFRDPRFLYCKITNPHNPASEHCLHLCLGTAHYTRPPPPPTPPTLTIASIHISNIIAKRPSALPMLQTAARICNEHGAIYIGADLNQAAYHDQLHIIFPWWWWWWWWWWWGGCVWGGRDGGGRDDGSGGVYACACECANVWGWGEAGHPLAPSVAFWGLSCEAC